MQLPQVDPKFTFWFGVWTQILLLLTGVGVDHAPALIAQYAPDVQWLCGVSYKVNNVVLTALVGISSTQAGPLISIPANAIKPLILMAAVLAGLFGFSDRADAATKPVFCDPAHLLPGCKKATAGANSTMPPLADGVQNLLDELQTRNADFVSNVVAGINEADADAGTIVVPATATAPAQVKDPISHACYPAQVQYLKSLPTAMKIAVKPPYDVIVLFQYKRDFVNMVLAGQLIPAYLKVGCAALLGNEAAILVATLGVVGVGTTTLGPITAFAGTLGTAAISLPAIAAIIPK